MCVKPALQTYLCSQYRCTTARFQHYLHVGVVIRDEVSRGWWSGVTGVPTTVTRRHIGTGWTTRAVGTVKDSEPLASTSASC